MSRFVGHIVVEPLDGEDYWIVRKPFLYVDDLARYSATVPEGFITDFASIPRILWPVLSPIDWRYRAAAVCHDLAYEIQMSKADADMMLWRAAAVTDAAKWQRAALWWGVHLGGHAAYISAPYRQVDRLRAYEQLVKEGKA